jgi:DNA-binding response OmpR family regulator
VRVLVVEDDPSLGPILQRGLRQQDLAVDLATTVAAATEAMVTTAYDVVCLDLGLPDGDGLDLCRRVHTARWLRRPHRILALTARDAVADRVAGLDAGADDYLVKPFDLTELVARLRALARRRDQPTAELRVGALCIDTAARTVTRDGRPIDLTSKEFTVLRYLTAHAGEVLSAERLLEGCWDANADDLTASVRVILSRIRRKLGHPPLVRTIPGAGYVVDRT